MRNDKISHMKMANKKFQERFTLENKMAQDEGKEIEMPDINPQLTNLLQPLMKNQ